VTKKWKDILGHAAVLVLFLALCAYAVATGRRECHGQCAHDRECQRLCLSRDMCPSVH
jgi:hypothetical protein